jgi:hypothetical protein
MDAPANRAQAHGINISLVTPYISYFFESRLWITILSSMQGMSFYNPASR